MSNIKNFHDSTVEESILTTAIGGWVVTYKPQRSVDYTFRAHYHPHVDALIEKLNTDGLESLMNPAWQAGLSRPLAPALYQPGSHVVGDFPKEEIDVSDDGPYSIYNWELFF